MAEAEATCWTVIEAAASGRRGDWEEFVQRYGSVVRAYLAARWRSSPCLQELEDAAQEVFVECLRPRGALERLDPNREFRPFFFGVVRKVALRFERECGRRREQGPSGGADLDGVADDAPSLSRVFDRAWAKALLREAARRMERRAADSGHPARRRVELLRMRFQDQLPIREIVVRWGVEAGVLHHEYAKARQEFKAALKEVVAFHHPHSAETIEQECAELLAFFR